MAESVARSPKGARSAGGAGGPAGRVVAATGAGGASARRISAPAVLAAATVCATALDTAGRLTKALPVTIYQIVLLAGLATLAGALLSERLTWRRTPLDLPLVVFAVALAAATVVGLPLGFDPMALAKVASSMLLFVLIVQAVRTRAERDLVVSALLATVGLSAAYALAARFAGLSVSIISSGAARTSGTFDDPNIFGTVLVLGLAVGGALWMESPGWRRPWVLALSVPAVVALIFTFSRGAAVAALVAALVVIAASRRPVTAKVAVIVGATLLVAVLFTTVVPPQFIYQKIEGAGVDPSAVGRIYMWRSSAAMAATYPLGIGPGGFPKVYPSFRLRGAAPGLVESHNAYLTLLVELGVLGLAAVLWLAGRYSVVVVTTLRAGAPRDRALALGAAAAAAAIAVQATTYSLEFSKPLWITFALGVLAWVGSRDEAGATRASSS